MVQEEHRVQLRWDSSATVQKGVVRACTPPCRMHPAAPDAPITLHAAHTNPRVQACLS